MAGQTDDIKGRVKEAVGTTIDPSKQKARLIARPAR